LRRGAFAQAAVVAERAVELCQGRDFAALWMIPATILGFAHARAGRLGEGVTLLERVLNIASVLAAPVLGFLGEAHLLASRFEEASTAGHRALQLATERGERGWEAWTLRLLGDVAASRTPADISTSEDAYRRALALAGELGMRPLMAHCQLGLGRLYRYAGKRPHALEHLGAATTMFKEMDMAWWLDHAEREMQLLA
jgi:tetratricopeptide (TPR) repeat protein